MTQKDFSKNKINKVLNKQEILEDTILQTQINIALNNDITADINQQKQLESSLAFEKTIENILKKYKLEFYTEEQLRKQDNKTVLTPDILFIKPIKINNETIHWIDAKDYYGSNLHTISSRLKKQSKKYNEAFGKGAFVFHHGLSEKLKIDNTLLLSI